jgi:hypothetical protein
MVFYFFGTKQGLFSAVIDMSDNVPPAIESIFAGGLDAIGECIVRTLVENLDKSARRIEIGWCTRAGAGTSSAGTSTARTGAPTGWTASTRARPPAPVHAAHSAGSRPQRLHLTGDLHLGLPLPGPVHPARQRRDRGGADHPHHRGAGADRRTQPRPAGRIRLAGRVGHLRDNQRIRLPGPRAPRARRAHPDTGNPARPRDGLTAAWVAERDCAVR